MRVILALLLTVLCLQSFSQSWLFAKRRADSLTYREIKTDKLDNIIVSSFSSNISSTTALCQLVKYDKFGNLLWKNNITTAIYSGQYTSYSGIQSHTNDNASNIYIVSTNITKINDSVFAGSTRATQITKFDPNGHIKW